MVGAIIVGFQRALFSNEAGIGSAPIAHSAVQTEHPASEGLVSLLEPFIDTVVICTLSSLVIVTTAYPYGIIDSGLEGIALTSASFEHHVSWAPYPLAVAALLFAFYRVKPAPFCFLDEMGPVTFEPGQGIDVLPRLRDAGLTLVIAEQQVLAARVAVEDAQAELAQHVDLVRVDVEHRGAHAVGQQHAADDVPEPAEAGDDDRVLLVDRVGVAPRRLARAGSRLQHLLVEQHHQRRQRHGEQGRRLHDRPGPRPHHGPGQP